MKRYLVLAAIVAFATIAHSQQQQPPGVIPAPVQPAAPPVVSQTPPASKAQVDSSEITRWGDRVVVSGEGPRAGESVLFTQAMSPPEDDSDCWFVTLWGNSKDQATEGLRRAFEKDDNLTPFVAVPPGKSKPWAHFNTYYGDDETQTHRFKTWKIDPKLTTPVVTISPPRNGQWNFQGKYAVVAVIPYGVAVDPRTPAIDTPEKLKKAIVGNVAMYCKRVQDAGQNPRMNSYGHRSPPPAGYTHSELPAADDAGHGQQPVGANSYTAPYAAPPAQQPFNPMFPTINPALTPVQPQTPTVDYMFIKQLIPTAPEAFILQQLQQQQLAPGSVTPTSIFQAWAVYQNNNGNANSGGGLFGGWGFTGGILGLLLGVGGMWLKNYRTQLNTEPGDQPFEKIVNLLDQFVTLLRNGSSVIVSPQPPIISQSSAPLAPASQAGSRT